MTQASSRHRVAIASTPDRSLTAFGGQASLPGLGHGEEQVAEQPPSREFWIAHLRNALATQSRPDAIAVAEQALQAWPTDPEILLLVALTALAENLPERALVLLKRFSKRYVPGKPVTLLTALALAQQGHFARASRMLRAEQLDTDRAALTWFVGDTVMADWLYSRLREIRVESLRSARSSADVPRRTKLPATRSPAPILARRGANGCQVAPEHPPRPTVRDLPRLEARFDMTFELANADAIQITGDDADPDMIPFYLRGELVRLCLFEGFDELLCLPSLQEVEPHWYQIETVRKVLKQYRGRVLLADEVGLGKTIEAGMVVKEYILRGMAERILILTPASLVGQWRDEMASKFGIDCATSHDPLLRDDPAAFWDQPRVIASIAAARRREQAAFLAGLNYDVVVVDEAHHLRDQTSASYRLVNSLQKRFLLLLSATPVQNSLLELYNLLTLLQPGIFKTQKEFRSVFMVPGKPASR